MSGLPRGNFPSVLLHSRALGLGVEVVVDNGLWFLWVPAQEAFGIAHQPTPIRLDPKEITQGSFVFILFLAGSGRCLTSIFFGGEPKQLCAFRLCVDVLAVISGCWRRFSPPRSSLRAGCVLWELFAAAAQQLSASLRSPREPSSELEAPSRWEALRLLNIPAQGAPEAPVSSGLFWTKH